MLKHNITEMYVTSDNGMGMRTGQFPGGNIKLLLPSKRWNNKISIKHNTIQYNLESI